MSIITDKKGNKLLDVIQGNEESIINDKQYQPLTASLVIVKSPKGFMLLKNRFRKEWEISGGLIDEGETPKQCAIRECFEESGYHITDLRFVGMLKFFLVPNYFSNASRIEYSTLYCANIDTFQEFIQNNEMLDLCWYKQGDTLDCINEIDMKLFDYYYD